MIQNKLKQGNRWLLILYGMLLMMLMGTVYSYSVFRVALEKTLAISTSESGMPYMVALACYALFMFLSGKYVERYSPKVLISLGGLMVASGWVMASFSNHIVTLTVCYGAIGGAGVGIAYGAILNVIGKWFPDKKGFALGLVLLGFGLSPLITAPLAGKLVASHGVMGTFRWMGLIFGIAIPVLALGFKRPENEDLARYRPSANTPQQGQALTREEMVKTKSFKGLYVNFVIGTMIGLKLIGMTTSVGTQYFNLPVEQVTQLIAVFAIFNGLGRPTFGWLTDQLSSRRAMLLSYGLMLSAACLLLFFKADYWVFIVSFALFWFNLGGWLAIAPTSTMKLYGAAHSGENYGLVFTAYGIGAILGVSGSGLILDFFGGYLAVFQFVVALCVLGIGITLRTIKA